MTKKTIGINPLTEYLSLTQVEQQHAEKQPLISHAKKQRVTIHVSTNLIERVKNAVFWEPGLTMAAFAETALAVAIEKLEHERGQPYPQRKQQLKGGRPLT